MSLTTPSRRGSMMTATAGWNHPEFPPNEEFSVQDQRMALGGVEWVSADPGQISWHVTGVYTVGQDMVKGY